MSNKREFSLGAVLSVTGDILLVEFGEVPELLRFMTGEDPFTHQLTRFAKECKPYLLREHPHLATIDTSHVNNENVYTERAKIYAQYGETLMVSPIPQDDHDFLNPIEELEKQIGADRIIVIDMSEVEQQP